jgi:hypothetical protein
LILRQYGPVPADAIAALIKELDHKDARVRAKAVLVLGQFGTSARPAVPALTRALKDADEQVRLLAALTLARIERKPLDDLEAVQNAVRQQGLALKDALQQRPVLAGQPVGQAIALGLPHLILIQAMGNPRLQMAYRHFFQLFISVVVAQQFDPRMTPLRQVFDQQMDLFGPEAIPALIDAINLVASHRVGFI